MCLCNIPTQFYILMLLNLYCRRSHIIKMSPRVVPSRQLGKWEGEGGYPAAVAPRPTCLPLCCLWKLPLAKPYDCRWKGTVSPSLVYSQIVLRLRCSFVACISVDGVRTYFVTPRDRVWENDSRRAPMVQVAHKCARRREAGINQQSGSQIAHLLVLQDSYITWIDKFSTGSHIPLV